MELIRKQTYITPEQDRAMKRLAEQYHVTEAEIVRRALESWLHREHAQMSEDPFAPLIGIVEGPAEIDHNDIYR